MLFWTKDEYLKFADSMMDKPLSFYAFEVLYWCGVRAGELLALTPADFDFEKNTVSVTKSYQRLRGKDVITDPKTPKSKRVIQIPEFLSEEIQEYIKSLYGCAATDRLFPVTKSYLHHEMTRGAKEQGIKRIRIHDISYPNKIKIQTFSINACCIAWAA
jgi:integrase